jgi:hypothetical protein
MHRYAFGVAIPAFVRIPYREAGHGLRRDTPSENLACSYHRIYIELRDRRVVLPSRDNNFVYCSSARDGL